eukprot:SAG11_NODE_22431_length_406_cov_0.771987_1_plen_84_part_10
MKEELIAILLDEYSISKHQDSGITDMLKDDPLVRTEKAEPGAALKMLKAAREICYKGQSQLWSMIPAMDLNSIRFDLRLKGVNN